MPVHRLLLAEIKPRVIVAFGEDVGIWLTGVEGRQWGFDANFDWKKRDLDLLTGVDEGTGLLLLPHFGERARGAWTRHKDRLDAAIDEARSHKWISQFGAKWSDELRQATKAALEEWAVLPAGDNLSFKHVSCGFGVMELTDRMRGNLRITIHGTGEAIVFANAEELIQAGWALD